MTNSMAVQRASNPIGVFAPLTARKISQHLYLPNSEVMPELGADVEAAPKEAATSYDSLLFPG